MTQYFTPTLKPTWQGSAIDHVLAPIRERNQHSPGIVALYEESLRGHRLAIPKHVLADTSVIDARLRRLDEQAIQSARTTGWASSWSFPESIDWSEGDDLALLEALLSTLNDRNIVQCGEIIRFKRRTYSIVYVLFSADSAGQRRIIDIVACPTMYIR